MERDINIKPGDGGGRKGESWLPVVIVEQISISVPHQTASSPFGQRGKEPLLTKVFIHKALHWTGVVLLFL